ncbi:MAG: hypothetical protein ACRD15_17770 [Vicinamibacterales bacterium]
MGADLLPPDGNPDPRPRRITCEFCDSQLTAGGEVITLSAKAKEHRRLDERLEAANKRVGELENELRESTATIAQLRQQLADATSPKPARSSRSIFEREGEAQ